MDTKRKFYKNKKDYNVSGIFTNRMLVEKLIANMFQPIAGTIVYDFDDITEIKEAVLSMVGREIKDMIEYKYYSPIKNHEQK